MFSGIVECMGTITQVIVNEGCKVFSLFPAKPFDDLKLGDSVAVNGVCLTVTELHQNTFSVTAVPETLKKTNLQKLNPNNQVNLERALQVNARVGGHFIQGHVDAMSEILSLERESSALIAKMSIPPHLNQYLIDKGYVSLDGMSITIIETTPTWFTVTFIPHTQQQTITHQYTVGSLINLEVDAFGKYIEKLIGAFNHVTTH